ncbi:hypothetical protein B0O99DRAFT_547580 [Bisporella sp. PMI_857]|nr:hypothetical protein B0O99DRAFT_547580 [Bisporella sp. PMI_857]
MADPAGSTLNLTAEEKRVFGQLFRKADSDNLGVVTGEVAVKFFESTRLEPRVLGEIWQIADTENRGLLTPAGFGIVLRLIGHYQAGREPTPELARQPGPLPRFDGDSAGDLSSTGIQPPPGPPPNALQPQASGSAPIRVPPLTRDKATQYALLFEKSGAQNGILPGEQAKQIFERAGLPNEILGRIWNLADTEQRGALVVTEFVIAMHLLASFKSGSMRALPNILPAGLYEAASVRPPSRQGSAAGSMSAIPRQLTGQGTGRASSPLSRTAYTAPQQFPQGTGFANNWAITPADKDKFDKIYYGLDKNNRGFITGDEAVPFFSESKLPEEALAQIWDLADINSGGRLSKDEFAVAMYLIRQQRSKRDGRDSLPATLPPNLVPPSMRNQSRPANLPTAPAFENPAPTLPKSAAEDLFGLDALSTPSPVPTPAAAPTQAPQSTGGSGSFGSDPFGRPPNSPTAGSQQQSQVFKPFAPSSSFGQTLNQNVTGGSGSFGASAAPLHQKSISEDLLGDNDPEVSSKLTNETSELANLSNQVGNLSRQMQDVQGQRATSQNELNQASSQKREFELRLAQLRSLYEQEVKDVKSLEERLITSRNETKKLQTEIAMAEGTYKDLQTQHQQIFAALQADQQENASLKDRMRVVNAEIAQMKPALEKLRSDARQQKGLVAINKKQLATNEGEREKLKTEAVELNKSIEDDKKELAAAALVQSPPQVASPALSTMSANNPFFRRKDSSNEVSSPYVSPSAQSQQDQSFENVFGPSFGAAAVANESSAPPASFKQDSETRSLAGSTSTIPARALSSSGSGLPSPAGSPSAALRELPQTNEPPPPPESRQLSSSFLPFPAHNESISSSRQVSAPNSRFGEGSTGVETPTNYIGATPTGSSNLGGSADSVRATSPGLDRKSNASPAAFDFQHKDSIPGAFPGDPNSQILDMPTGGSTLSEQAAASPFAITKEPVGNVKDDFDAAFAGFGNSAKPQERSNTGSSTNEGSSSAVASGFNKEFPPIAELDDDDDSDSTSDAGGFDDDFAPGSPSHTRNASSTQGITESTATNGINAKDLLESRPALSHNTSTISSPPTPGAQTSPPPYDKTVTSAERAQSEVQEYSGLLPKREDPTSPPTASAEPTSGTSQSSHLTFATAPSPFGSSPTVTSQSATAPAQSPFGSSPAVTTQAAPPPAPAKVPFDDDFDDFEDLEDAKEGDADDDFANISVHDRSGLDDFNPMFDSPPVPPAKNAKPAEQPSQINTSHFGGADDVFGEYTQSPATQPTAPANTAVHDNNDWDAIFAGLDAPATTSTPEPAKPVENNSISSAAPERPVIGRALTEAGVHDDPILKNLTGMGYKRSEALAALEKYDYNLERAANFLASQS